MRAMILHAAHLLLRRIPVLGLLLAGATAPAAAAEATPPWVSLTGQRCVNLIVTEMAVIEVTAEGLLLREVAPDTTVDAVRKATGTELIVRDPVKTMES